MSQDGSSPIGDARELGFHEPEVQTETIMTPAASRDDVLPLLQSENDDLQARWPYLRRPS